MSVRVVTAASLNITSYTGTGVATVDNRMNCIMGTGGVSILWRICYDSVIGVDWITGIAFDKRYVVLCVYMPYECNVN